MTIPTCKRCGVEVVGGDTCIPCHVKQTHATNLRQTAELAERADELSPPPVTEVVVYDFADLTAPIFTDWNGGYGTVSVMFGNVAKPELRYGQSLVLLVPKAWDIVQVGFSAKASTERRMAVVIRQSVREVTL